MLDRDGYRPNVGILLLNAHNDVFWGKRVNQHAWQFPQGGIKAGESPEQAMYRELEEEVGLKPEHVRILGRTRHWLRYDFRASPLGKAATITQFLAIGALVMGWPAHPLAWGAFALGIIALGDYVRRAVELGRQRLRETEQGNRS